MGVGVSNWELTRAVSIVGQVGIVSGTALDIVLARRLQLGDADGRMRHALAAFPDQKIAKNVLDCYFIEGGKAPEAPFKTRPMINHRPTRDLVELQLVAGFVEIFLAKEGHDGLVGINFLEKIQTPTLPTLYGAMLASVDIVAVGAGIPREIPGILDKLTANQPASLKLAVQNQKSSTVHTIDFDPAEFLPSPLPTLKRPRFFPIVASVTLANMMVKKTAGVDGLIIEGPTAGGHNAPPRGGVTLNAAGEPIYGKRDNVDLAAIKDLGVPFWVAGSCGSPESLQAALAAGASGVQVGSLFAFCEESGIAPELKQKALEASQDRNIHVHTDSLASPTGFPFKVLRQANTLSEAEEYEARPRVCDLGFVREAYEQEDGTVAWRCKAEDCGNYVSKGGQSEDTVGKKCLCNGLMANIGLGQIRPNGSVELPLITCGDETADIAKMLKPGNDTYSAADVVEYLLAGAESTSPSNSPCCTKA